MPPTAVDSSVNGPAPELIQNNAPVQPQYPDKLTDIPSARNAPPPNIQLYPARQGAEVMTRAAAPAISRPSTGLLPPALGAPPVAYYACAPPPTAQLVSPTGAVTSPCTLTLTHRSGASTLTYTSQPYTQQPQQQQRDTHSDSADLSPACSDTNARLHVDTTVLTRDIPSRHYSSSSDESGSECAAAAHPAQAPYGDVTAEAPPTLMMVPPPPQGLPAPAQVSPPGAAPALVSPIQPAHVNSQVQHILPVSITTQMELVWHGEFDRLFRQFYPQQWTLHPTAAPPTGRWKIFKDSAKVRFCCQNCGHGWTSMKGRVIFWFQMDFTLNSGSVLFKLYGQQCRTCKQGDFDHAMWYPEEVIKVVGNVYNRIGQVFYNFYRPPLRIDRRPGKPRNQHNSELCQACRDGICREEWTFS